MSLNAPNLDNRTFQQLVDDMRSRIPTYCGDWTDINLSDPGITLIELFAFMGEQLLYRMNQVPELHLRKFLEMLGMQRQEPTAARAQVTFWLSKPLAEGEIISIPDMTEVATQQSESEPSIVFTVESQFELRQPSVEMILIKSAGGGAQHRYRYHKGAFREENATSSHQDVSIVPFVSEPPRRDDALYIGFADDPSNYLLYLNLEVDGLRGAGGSETGRPPYSWEAHTGISQNEGWEPCAHDDDRTNSMNRSGVIQFHVPNVVESTQDGHNLYWIRMRLEIDNSRDRRIGYVISPLIRRMEISIAGCTVTAIHAEQVPEEILGVSDGTADQRFKLERTPILQRKPALEYLRVEPSNAGNGETNGQSPFHTPNEAASSQQHRDSTHEHWIEQPDFADSTPDSPHFTLDSMTGEIRLGPAVRQPNGALKQYGKIPDSGARLVFTRYRVHDGMAGNVGANRINTLKTSLGYVKRVANRTAASGGQNAESIEELKLRAAKLLRTPSRAVTAEDYEYLATTGFNSQVGEKKIAAAKCHKPGEHPDEKVANGATPAQYPQKIRLTILPFVKPSEYEATSLQEAARRAFDALFQEREDNDDEWETLQQFLDGRCLLTTSTEIDLARFKYVSVHVTISSTASNQYNANLRTTILAKLHQLIHPLHGGPTGAGWPIGQPLRISDVYECLRAGGDGIEPRFLMEVVLFEAQNAAHRGIDEAKDIIQVDNRSVLCSAQHHVTIRRLERAS